MSEGAIRVIGTDKVVKAFNQRLREIGGVTFQELIRAGLSVQRRSQEHIRADHLIDTGNLRASAFTVWTNGPQPASPGFSDTGKKSGKLVSDEDMGRLASVHDETLNMAVEEAGKKFGGSLDRLGHVVVGYGAYYALYVHEDGVARNWVGAKFLERALAEVAKELPQALAGKLGKLK